MKVIAPSELDFAVEVLNRGGLAVFPTDTLYGLGGNAYSSNAVSRVFECKGRRPDKPIGVCYPSLDRAAADVVITEELRRLAEKFLPGALTLILKKSSSSKLSPFCSNTESGVGIRIPDNDIVLDLLRRLDFPLTATSANKSGEPPPKNANEAYACLQNYKGDLVIIDGDSCALGSASTIIDLCAPVPKIVRKGPGYEKFMPLLSNNC